MRRFSTFAALAVIGVSACLAGASDKPKKPLGSWTREAGENKITFTFKEEILQVDVQLGSNKIKVECDYAVARDGSAYARIAKVTKEGTENGPKEGEMFSFGYDADGGKLTIRDWKGHTENPEAKALVEGEYTKK